MKESINKSRFMDAFMDSDRKGNFTYAGLNALYDYLVEFEESTGTEIELDVIALCCDFAEYENLEEVQENYGDIKSLEDLENHTMVIQVPPTGFDNFPNRLIIQNF